MRAIIFIILLFQILSTFNSISPHLSRSKRIADGSLVQDGKYPFASAIVFGDNLIDGATVVSSQFVLTSCHATNKINITYHHNVLLYLGHVHLKGKDPEYAFGIKKIICHPKFDPKTGEHDIALLQLDRKIDFFGAHQRVRPACLALSAEADSTYDPTECVAMGWGETKKSPSDERTNPATSEQLRDVPMVILDPPSDEPCSHYYPPFNRESMICAGRKGGTCFGDAGGPLACPIKNSGGAKFCVVGIITAIRNACEEGNFKPSIFTRVHFYAQWLKEITG